MEKVVGIGGVFFKARDPEALGAWYQEVLGADITTGIWFQEAGPTVLAPFPESTDYFDRDTQAFMINFRVHNLDAMMDQLRARGLTVITKEEWDSEAGRFARIHDPEGNPIELWQPPSPPDESPDESSR
ncbi:MAG: VOC family protein [Pseudomonadota bacterium]